MPEEVAQPMVSSEALEVISSLTLMIFICLAFLFVYLFINTILQAYHDRELRKGKIAHLLMLTLGTGLLILLAFLTLPRYMHSGSDNSVKISKRSKPDNQNAASTNKLEEIDPLLQIPTPKLTNTDVRIETDLLDPGHLPPPRAPYSHDKNRHIRGRYPRNP